MRAFRGNLTRLALFYLLFLMAAAGTRGQGTMTFLQTGTGGPLISVPVALVPGSETIQELSFRFGFTTDEVSVPGELLDALTASLYDQLAILYLPLVTTDASGAVWVPGGEGTVPLAGSEVIRQAIPYPTAAPSFALKQAWQVQLLIPAVFHGNPLTVYFDLFDNDNGVNSAAWFDEVRLTPVPEPGMGSLMVAGSACLVWILRRRRL